MVLQVIHCFIVQKVVPRSGGETEPVALDIPQVSAPGPLPFLIRNLFELLTNKPLSCFIFGPTSDPF